MAKEKFLDKFKKTGLNAFLTKVKEKAPDILSAVVDIAANPNPLNAIQEIGSLLKGSSSPEAKALITEFDLKKIEFENELLRIEAQDRDSARNREVEMAKAGKSNWMQYMVGIVGLSAFLGIIYMALFEEVKNENLFYFIAGNVFGISASIFAYYFGTSKSSADKTKMLGK